MGLLGLGDFVTLGQKVGPQAAAPFALPRIPPGVTTQQLQPGWYELTEEQLNRMQGGSARPDPRAIGATPGCCPVQWNPQTGTYMPGNMATWDPNAVMPDQLDLTPPRPHFNYLSGLRGLSGSTAQDMALSVRRSFGLGAYSDDQVAAALRTLSDTDADLAVQYAKAAEQAASRRSAFSESDRLLGLAQVKLAPLRARLAGRQDMQGPLGVVQSRISEAQRVVQLHRQQSPETQARGRELVAASDDAQIRYRAESDVRRSFVDDLADAAGGMVETVKSLGRQAADALRVTPANLAVGVAAASVVAFAYGRGRR